MTVNQLYDIVHKLVVNGYGRKPVYVDKPSFQDNRESDGCVFMPAWQAYVHTFPMMDDDGGIACRKDGSERQIKAFLIVGDRGRSANEIERLTRERDDARAALGCMTRAAIDVERRSDETAGEPWKVGDTWHCRCGAANTAERCSNCKRARADEWGDGRAEKAKVHHTVKCKKFPDPFDERDPVGPCTCGAESAEKALPKPRHGYSRDPCPCKGHPLNCFDHPRDCGCTQNRGADSHD